MRVKEIANVLQLIENKHISQLFILLIIIHSYFMNLSCYGLNQINCKAEKTQPHISLEENWRNPWLLIVGTRFVVYSFCRTV